METILVWALIIAAIAIIAMLVLLIASEREVNRKRLEVESLSSRLASAGATLDARANLLADQGTAIPSGMARLTEQVRANEVAIATMQCELEALRAENSWLKQECAAHQIKSSGPEIVMRAESTPAPQVEQTERAADFRLDLGPRRSRFMFPATAAALLLIALVSVFFARAKPTSPLARQGQSAAGARIHLETVSAITAAAESSDLKSEPELASKTISAKKRAEAPAGSSYEVVRATRVFSEPSENSRPLARVEAGTEINVVGARNEWLEVRSRHGRPSGFIRKDTAVEKSLR
jgi:hypothetical protein